MSDGAQTATTTFAVTGLIANTTYTVTMLVGALDANGSATGTAKISWDTGTLVSGRYAYGASATQTLSASDTSTTLANLSAVELKITTDSNGAFNIKLYNGDSDNSGSKTSIGFFAITGDVIPEPSAFGLLAGVGALALAASRRRRSRK